MLGRTGERRVTRIVDGDQHIAQETIAAGALDRGLGKQRTELRVVEPGELRKPGRAQSLARGELGLAALHRELVPRANRQAIVAAIDAVAYSRAEFMRDRPLMLDGEIRNAAPRIEAVRLRKRRGRADVETGTACAATVRLRRIGRQIERGENRAEEKPRAIL